MRPPLILGGQGRTSASVRRDGSALVLTLLGFALLAGLLFLRACAGGAS